MKAPSILLASASPRRRRLVGWLGIPVRVTAMDTAEDLSAPLEPAALATSLALEKARAAREADAGEHAVLAFDTIVVARGRLLGKPADEAEARAMLALLSGDTHDVVTGVAMLDPRGAERTFAVTTPVRMRALSPADLEAWLSDDEYLGCAGAYNIERHLASVDGDQCFQNVAGIPLCHCYRALATGAAGIIPAGLTRPIQPCDAALGRRCGLGPRVCDVDRDLS